MQQLALHLLDNPRVEIDGAPVRFERRNALAILIFLACEQRPHSREGLASLLWSGYRQKSARHNLNNNISSLRKALPGQWLDVTRSTICLPPNENLSIDIQQFRSHLAASRNHGHPPEEPCPTCVTMLEQATALYHDGFLGGFGVRDAPEFEQWQRSQADLLLSDMGAALQQLSNAYADLGDFDRARRRIRRLLHMSPLDERAHRTLVRIHLQSGERAGALAAFDNCLSTLAAENVVPTAATMALAQAIEEMPTSVRGKPGILQQGDSAFGGHSDDQAEKNAAQLAHLLQASNQDDSEERYLENLPTPMTSFIGRADELRALKRLLTRPERRLVTIVGAGGMGKSRLAVQLADKLRVHYRNGVVFVPLVGVDDVDQIAGAIANALGLLDGGKGGDARHRVAHFLKEKKMLLLLDNFEQLVAGAGLISDLLQETENVQFLVTSRVRLNLREEWTFQLHRLAHPGRSNERTAERTEPSYAAIDLFNERASQVDPEFDPAAELHGIESICRLVEGMPLAIELAATWVRVLPAGDIASALEQDLDILTTSFRNQAPEHGSLRTVFERSWHLLTDDEQRALARLSVFRGGFDRTSAASVAGATTEMLARLVDQCLIRRQPAGRFDIHEMLRKFSEEKLAAFEGRIERARQQHCAYFSGLVETMSWRLERRHDSAYSTDADAFRALSTDIDNVTAAWRWAVRSLDGDRVGQMVCILADYLVRTGQLDEMENLYGVAVDTFTAAKSLDADTRNAVIGALLLHKGFALTERHDRKRESRDILIQSLTFLRADEEQESVDIAFALVELGTRCSGLGENEEGIEYINEGLSMFETLQHRQGIGWAHRNLGVVGFFRGTLAASERSLTRALEVLDPGDVEIRLEVLHMLGITYTLQGAFGEAENLLVYALEHYHAEDPVIHYVQRNLADLLIATGRFREAAALFSRAEIGFRQMGMAYHIDIGTAYSPGMLPLFQGRLAEANQQLVKTLSTARRVGYKQRIVIALLNLSRARFGSGDYGGALELIEEALALARDIDYRYGIAYSLCQLGHVSQALARWTQADRYFTEAFEVCVAEKIYRIAVDALLGVARQMLHVGNIEKATEMAMMANNHPASDFDTRRKAGEFLHDLDVADIGNAERSMALADLNEYLREMLQI